MEGDYRRCGDCNAYLGFQSTPSAWRETYVSSDAFAASHISIHSLRMEGDRPHPRWTQFRSHFNPLPPHGGRHWIDGFFDKFAKISIHSLRMEGDYWISVTLLESFSFQSTPSAWRETTYISPRENFSQSFQSTPSAWRETGWGADMAAEKQFISIHSLRMEGDYIDLGYLCGGVYFNPLPPHGGRQDKLPVEANFENISIHSLRMEGDTLIWLTEILQ